MNWLHVPVPGIGPTLEIARSNERPTRYRPQRRLGMSIENNLVYVPDGRENLILEYEHRDDERPVMVTYGPGKPSTHELTTLRRVRTRCAAWLRSHAGYQALLIGLRPPQRTSEPFWYSACESIRRTATRATYVNPSASDCREMSLRGFVSVRNTLEQFMISSHNSVHI